MAAAKPKKPAGSKHIIDVAHPDTSPPSETSKSIITSRPIMKDPMMATEAEDPAMPVTEKPTQLLGKTGETKIKPLAEKDQSDADDKSGDDKTEDETATTEGGDAEQPPAKAAGEEDEAPAEKVDTDEEADDAASDAATVDDAAAPPAGKGKAAAKKITEDDAAQAAEKAAAEAEIRKLVESRKYFLPINAVEHRRSKRVAVAGMILALVLAVAWVDVALDAGLISLGGVKPVTHLFSN